MVDRQARDQLALALRRLITGRITNDDFDEAIPSLDDPCILPIYDCAWTLYDDNFQHHLTGRFELSPVVRREVARWIMFLYTDLEYDWPRARLITVSNWPLNFLTLGWWEARKWKKQLSFMKSGHCDVWPFRSRPQFRRYLESSPKLVETLHGP
jgi:hypothetical protein